MGFFIILCYPKGKTHQSKALIKQGKTEHYYESALLLFSFRVTIWEKSLFHSI